MTSTPNNRRRRRDFPGTPHQVGVARRWVRAQLNRHPATPNAVLLASELATNAIRHTASGDGRTFTVALDINNHRVRIEIADRGTAASRPHLTRAGAGDQTGRGLVLVNGLANRWGVHGGRQGRTVWFELDNPNTPPTPVTTQPSPSGSGPSAGTRDA